MQLAKFAAQNPAMTQALAVQAAKLAADAYGPVSRAFNNRKNKNKQTKVTKMIKQPGYQAPVAINMPFNRTQPKFMGNMEGNITIKHSELVTTLFGSTGLSTVITTVQPGLPGAFPWLSSIAGNFEKYRIISMQFRYKPSAATSTAGSLLLAYTRDPIVAGGDITSVSELSQFPQFIDSSAFAPYTMVINPKMLGTELFVRKGFVADTDLKTYDHGALVIATDGFAATTQIGRVYVDYTVQLITPKPSNCPGVDFTVSSGATSAQLFASPGTVRKFPGIDVTLTGFTGAFQLRFNGPGSWLVVILIRSTARGTLVATSSAPLLDSFGQFFVMQDATSAATEIKAYSVIKTIGTTVLLTTGTAFGTITDAHLIITPAPEEILPGVPLS